MVEFDWEAWDASLPIDDEPLSNEEERQINGNNEYESLEDLKRILEKNDERK